MHKSYSEKISVITKAIQEQEVENQELEKLCAALEVIKDKVIKELKKK